MPLKFYELARKTIHFIFHFKRPKQYFQKRNYRVCFKQPIYETFIITLFNKNVCFHPLMARCLFNVGKHHVNINVWHLKRQKKEKKRKTFVIYRRAAGVFE